MKVHTDWLVSLIETLPGAVVGGRSQVFVTLAKYPDDVDGKVKLTYPHWIVYPSDGRDTTDRVTGPLVSRHPRFTIHSVALNADTAARAGEQVKALLVQNGRGVVPAIAGEKSERVWYSVPIPIQADSTAAPAVAFHVAECGFDSQVL